MRHMYQINLNHSFHLKSRLVTQIICLLLLVAILPACGPVIEPTQNTSIANARLSAPPTEYSRMVITNHGFSAKTNDIFLPVTVHTRGMGKVFKLADLNKGWPRFTDSEIVLDYSKFCQCYTYYGSPVTYIDLNDGAESDDINFANSADPSMVTYQANRSYAGVLVNGYKAWSGRPQFYQSILDKDGIGGLGSAVLAVSFVSGHGIMPGYDIGGPVYTIRIDIQRYNGQPLPATYALPVLYGDCGFSDTPILLDLGRYNTAMLQTLGIGNDKLSSLRIPTGYEVIVYEQKDFGGTSKSFRGPMEINCLKDYRFNDITSSIVVNKL